MTGYKSNLIDDLKKLSNVTFGNNNAAGLSEKVPGNVEIYRLNPDQLNELGMGIKTGYHVLDTTTGNLVLSGFGR